MGKADGQDSAMDRGLRESQPHGGGRASGNPGPRSGPRPRRSPASASSPPAASTPPGSATSPPTRCASPHLGPGAVLDLGCGVGHSYHLLAPPRDGRRRHRRRRRWRVRTARPWSPTCASCRSTTARFAVGPLGPVARARARPRARRRRGGAGARARRGRASSSPRTGSPSAAPTRSSTPTTTSSSTPRSCAASASAHFGEVEVLGLFGSAALHGALRRGAGDARPAAAPRSAAAAPAASRCRVKQRLYDALLRRYRRDDDPRAEAITPEDFELRAERPRRGARPLRGLPRPDRGA